jgi:Peptidase family M1 domain/Peptidase M1 N-terminal domain
MWRALLLLTLFSTSCAARPEPGEGKDLACSHARAAARGLPISPSLLYGSARDDADTNVLHYDLTLEVNPDSEWLTGVCAIRTEVLVDGLATFQVRLDDAFTIDAVEIDSLGIAWHRLDDATIEATLDRAYDAGEVFTLTVSYNGHPESANWGSIIFTTEGNDPLVYTLSQPWFAYTWWPTKDDLTDKATGDLRIIVPSDLTAAANGVLLSETDLGDDRTEFHFRTQYQTVPYLFCFAASAYNRFAGVWEYGDITMPLEFYIFPEDDNQTNRNKWLRSGDMLTVFSDVYGVYPFANEKYGIYGFGFGGGMEHQTMTGQGTFSEWITAHEAGHQWWGDMVTCATWHDIWLNEGFATYSEAIWQERKNGGIDTQALIDHMANRRPGRFDDSVYCYDLSNVGRIFSGDFTYRKGGWVLHQLRHVVGDDAFFQILADYRQAFEYDSAITADFQAVAESVTGADLDWFFQQCVYDIGSPSYEYAWRALDVAGAPYLELSITQVQTTDYPLFVFPVDIVVTEGAGDATHVVWNDADVEHFLIPLTETASAVDFDPQQWILWQEADEVAFLPGPPKLVETSPAPSSIVDGDTLAEIQLTFHKDVTAAAGDFAIHDSDGSPVAFDFAYDQVAQTVTLTPTFALEFGIYAVTASDTIVDVESAQALDGELTHAWGEPTLPSGDGLPGGDAVFGFYIPVPGDLDLDGDIDQQDLGLLLASYEFDDGGDVDGDGDTDQSDLGILLARFGYGA